MIEKNLKPIYDHDSYSNSVTKILQFELYYSVFKPLFDLLDYIPKKEPQLKSGSRWNAVGSELARNLKAGNVHYVDGYFYGIFNASMGKELRKYGAKFSQSKKAYKLPLNEIPIELKTLMVQAKSALQKKSSDLQAALLQIKYMPLRIDLGGHARTLTDNLNTQFIKTVKPAELSIPMNMIDGVKTRLEENYTANLNLHINDWKDEQMLRLHDQIQKNVEEGFRSEKMIDTIRAEYGVSANKAKFIARQETSLLVSKYRQERYTEAGIQMYRWSTSHDERVRSSHKELDKRVFSWDNPPVVDTATGRRANPGEDFNCRCIAIPIIRMSEANAEKG